MKSTEINEKHSDNKMPSFTSIKGKHIYNKTHSFTVNNDKFIMNYGEDNHLLDKRVIIDGVEWKVIGLGTYKKPEGLSFGKFENSKSVCEGEKIDLIVVEIEK